jgi:hypothetical protein
VLNTAMQKQKQSKSTFDVGAVAVGWLKAE